MRAALAPLLEADRAEPPATIPDPFGAGTLHVAVTRFGVGDDHGVLVAGSRNADFPTEQDRLLLGVGANQTAIVVQRRRAEEQVQEQRERLRVTLASIGDAVITTDTEGRVTFLNPVAEALTGWTHGGRRRASRWRRCSASSTSRPASRSRTRSRGCCGRASIVGLANHTVLIAKDGTERPIDDSAAPIRDAAGKMVGVVLIFRDVTEQRRAEQHRNVRLAVTHALSEAATRGGRGQRRPAGGVREPRLGRGLLLDRQRRQARRSVCTAKLAQARRAGGRVRDGQLQPHVRQGRGATGPGVGERQTGLDTRHRTGRELPPPRLRRRTTACTAPSPAPSSSATGRSA